MGDQPAKRDILEWVFLGFAIVLLFGLLFPGISRERRSPATEREARYQISLLVAALRFHQSEYGQFPLGDQAQVVASLTGKNPRNIVIYEPPNGRMNAKGELTDPWGTPYRFDLSDPKSPRVWSCARNRKDDGGAQSSDDIVSWR